MTKLIMAYEKELFFFLIICLMLTLAVPPLLVLQGTMNNHFVFIFFPLIALQLSDIPGVKVGFFAASANLC